MPACSAKLETLVGKHQPFDLELVRCRRFPGALYLAPVPERGFRALTAAIAGRWPEAPPYGGQFAEVVPHLAIAHSQDPQVFDMIESEISGRSAARYCADRISPPDGLHPETAGKTCKASRWPPATTAGAGKSQSAASTARQRVPALPQPGALLCAPAGGAAQMAAVPR